MGFYDKHILPHLINCACGLPAMMGQRAKLIPLATGRVLELGIGTGLNLPFYDAKKVSTIIGVDPAVGMHKKARERAEQTSIPVETVALELEQIAAEDDSFDSAVSTFTLCTIPDAVAALDQQPHLTGRLIVECQIVEFLDLVKRKRPGIQVYLYATEANTGIATAKAKASAAPQ